MSRPWQAEASHRGERAPQAAGGGGRDAEEGPGGEYGEAEGVLAGQR